MLPTLLAAVTPAVDPTAPKAQLLVAFDQLDTALRQAQLQPAPPPPGLTDRLQEFGTNWTGFVGIVFMLALIFVLWKSLKLMPRTKPVQIKPQANLEVGWSDIAGADEAKAELIEVVEFLRDPRPFNKLGAKVPQGVLLHGPPGTGKTLLAKAVAHESGAQFFSQSASSFVEMFAGLGAARIRRLFDEARKHEPAVIFIDELDAVGARRGSDNNSEREQTLNQLLVEMDGFASSDQVVVMAASNLLEKLDPALLRPGRFDRQVFVSAARTSAGAVRSSTSTPARSRSARTSTSTSSPSRPAG